MNNKKPVFSAPIKKENLPPSPMVVINGPNSRITPKLPQKQTGVFSADHIPIRDQSFTAFLKNYQTIKVNSETVQQTSSKIVQNLSHNNNEVSKDTPKAGNVTTPGYSHNPIPTPKSHNIKVTPICKPPISGTNIGQNQSDLNESLNKKSQTKLIKVTKSSEIKPPVKPNSAFLQFIVQSRATLMKKSKLSFEDANDKAVKIWRSKSQEIKSKHEMQYVRLKEKYDQRMIKYNERITKMREKEERIKGELLFLFLIRQLVFNLFS